MTSWTSWIPRRGDIIWVRTAMPEGAAAEGTATGVSEGTATGLAGGVATGVSEGVAAGGRDASRRRPALVLSPAAYNAKLGLAVVCPIAGEARGYPFEVAVPRGLPVSGAVLADRVTSLDWRTCGVRLACTVPDEVVAGVQERLLPLVSEHRRRR